jgi:hypothetical protein
MAKHTINVTQEDIDQGKRTSPTQCAVALAMRRETGNEWVVGEYDMDNFQTNIGVRLPEEARTFIKDFDYGRPVEPFSFTVDIADGGIK